MKLKNRVAIVIGGGKGIGRAISLALASEGATVVVAGRSLPSLEEVVKDIQNKGGEGDFSPAISGRDSRVPHRERGLSFLFPFFEPFDLIPSHA